MKNFLISILVGFNPRCFFEHSWGFATVATLVDDSSEREHSKLYMPLFGSICLIFCLYLVLQICSLIPLPSRGHQQFHV